MILAFRVSLICVFYFCEFCLKSEEKLNIGEIMGRVYGRFGYIQFIKVDGRVANKESDKI